MEIIVNDNNDKKLVSTYLRRIPQECDMGYCFMFPIGVIIQLDGNEMSIGYACKKHYEKVESEINE